MSPIYTVSCRLLLCLSVCVAYELLPRSVRAQGGIDEARGEATYRVDLLTPPGTAGLSPELALVYASGAATGPAGWLGFGWSLEGESRIERERRHGAPFDYEDRTCGPAADHVCYRDDFVLDGQDLICADADCSSCTPMQPCRFRTQRDDGRLIRFLGEADGWRIHDRRGRVLVYGEGSGSTILHPGIGQTFGWLLARQEDASGNWIAYDWDHGSSPGVAYLSQVRWAQAGASANRSVSFVLNDPGSAPREDAPIDYSSGFRQETDRRVARIEVRASGALVTRYEIDYVQDPHDARSLLASVQRVGSDGVTALSPHRFVYTASGDAFVHDPFFGDGACLPAAPTRSDDEGVLVADLIDVNRDGLVDLYASHPGDAEQAVRVNLGTGEGWEGSGPLCAPGPTWAGLDLPLVVAPGGNASQVVTDLDADGFPDHVDAGTREVRRGSAGGFEPQVVQTPDFAGPHGFALAPYAPWGLNSVRSEASERSITSRLTDVTGDGRPDLVLTRGVDFASYLFGDPGSACPEDPQACDPAWLAFTGWAVFPNLGIDLEAPLPTLRLPVEPLRFAGADLPGAGTPVIEHVSSLFYTDLTLTDVNGDGLADRLGQAFVQYGNGAGFAPPEEIPGLLPLRIRAGCVYADLIDLNGDGFVDHVSSEEWSATNPVWQVRYGNGRDFGVGWHAVHTASAGFKCLAGTPSDPLAYAAATRDVNGDGLADHVTGTISGAAYQVHLGSGARSGLLISATDPEGGTIEFAYGSALQERDASGAAANPRLWLPRPVVKRITVRDGREETPDLVTELSWAGGVFDVQEREFRGFASLRRHDPGQGPDDLRTVETRAVDRACAGRLETRELSGGGRVLRREQFVLDALEFGGVAPSSRWTRCLLRERLDTAVEGDAQAARTRRTVWDHGLEPVAGGFVVQRLEEWGEWDLESGDVPGDERFTEYAYAAPAPGASALLGHVSEERVTDASGATVAHTRVFYDDLPLHQVASGRVSRIDAWLESAASDPPQPGRWVTRARVSYDDWGNAVELREASSADEPQGRRVSRDFEPTYRTFAAATTRGGDPPEAVTTTWHAQGCLAGLAPPPGLGRVCRVIRPDGAQDAFGYDALGRLVRAERAHGPLEEIEWPSADSEPPAERRHARTLTAPDGVVLRFARWRDGLGRVFREESPGTSGETVRVDTTFGARGWIASRSLPYVDAPVLVRSYGYDALGRILRVDEPDGTTSRSRTYLPWGVRDEVWFDAGAARALWREQKRDGLGRLVRVADHADADGLVGPPFVVTAGYDAADRLAWVADPVANDASLCAAYEMGAACPTQEHVTRLGHDTLGRRVRLEHPDAGTWRFEFDDGDRLLRRIDPTGAEQVFAYDGLGRVVSRTVAPGGNGAADASFFWGASPGQPGHGRLVAVRSATTDYDYVHDAAGRVTHATQTTHGVAFHEDVDWDAFDRPIRRVFPDGETFHYGYDGLRLTTIQGDVANASWSRPVLREARYDASGRPERLSLGEDALGAASALIDFTYDAGTGRLARIVGTPSLSRADVDGDGDGVNDPLDVCPYAWDPEQRDSGGPVPWLVTAGPTLDGSPDGIGDACQCGDVSGDGLVEYLADAVPLLLWLADLAPAPPALDRCNTDGEPGCVGSDYYRMAWGLRGASPGIEQSCEPALPGHVPAQAAVDLSLTHDGLGRVSHVGGTLAGVALDREFAYDGLGRLIRARGPAPDLPGLPAGDVEWQYDYDPLGNPRARRASGYTLARFWYTHPDRPHALTRFASPISGDEWLALDAAGRPTARTVDGVASAGFEWNALNRLHRHGDASHAYDAFDRRVRTTRGSETIVHVGGDFDYHVQSGTATRTFTIHGIPIAVVGSVRPVDPPGPASAGRGPGEHGVSPEPFLALIADPTGSVRARVNADGTVVGTRDQDAHGLTTSRLGAFAASPPFAGRQAAAGGEGLVHMGARDYVPRWGRFLSPDEALESFDSQGLNPFTYARNQPTSRIDPDGRYSIVYYWLQPLTGHWSSTTRADLAWREGVRAASAAAARHAHRGELARVNQENAAVRAELAALGYDVGGTTLASFLSDNGVRAAPATSVLLGGVSSTPLPRTDAQRISLDGVMSALDTAVGVLVNDHQSMVAGVAGNVAGMMGALGQLPFSLLTLHPVAVWRAGEAVVDASVPRYGLSAGPAWGSGRSLGNAIDDAALIHDRAYQADGMDRTLADLELIRGVWRSHRLGPFGQVYRVGLTVVFTGKILLREAIRWAWD